MNWLQKISISAVKKRRIVIVHGWEGGPTKDWFPWLEESLPKRKYTVLNMSMPKPNTPKQSAWVKHLQDHIQPDNNTILVGHSIGCMAILRYLEKISNKIRAAILVAPYVENEKKYKTISSFFHGPLKWDRIKKNCSEIYTIHSDDDPYVSLWQEAIFKSNGATTFVEKGKGHFDVKKLPKVLKIIKDLD